MNVVDIAILALVAVMAIFGVYKGFIKSVISLLSFIISLALAILLARVVANALISVDFIGNWVAGDKSLYSLIYDKLPIPDALESITTSMLKSMSADEVFADKAPWYVNLLYPLIKGCLSNEVYLNSLDNARQIIALELAYGVFTVIVGILLFICFRIIAAAVSISFKKYTKGKKSLSGRAVGALIGSAKAVVYCMIILSVLTMFSNFKVMEPVSSEISSSKLGKPLADASLKVSTAMLESKDDDRYQRLVELCKQSGEDNNDADSSNKNNSGEYMNAIDFAAKDLRLLGLIIK